MSVASECGVSARHLSFVETGRARPSRQLIVHLARYFHATQSEVNVCLLAAGYAPLRASTQEQPVTTALELLLHHHSPNPAFVFDADWQMRRLNAGGQWLCSLVMPEMWAGIAQPDVGVDMIAALAHPGGLLALVRDAPSVGVRMVEQLRLELMTNPQLGPRVELLERSLMERFDARPPSDPGPITEPTFRMTFDTWLGPLSYFTVQGVLGIPDHVTGGWLRTELWYPADARTRLVAAAHVGPASHTAGTLTN